MKLLDFNAWRCQIDRKQELKKQSADKTDDEIDGEESEKNDRIDLSSDENSDESIQNLTQNLNETILSDEEKNEQENLEDTVSLDNEVDDDEDFSDISSDEDVGNVDEVFADNGEIKILDDNGDLIFGSGKDGLLSAARFFAKLLMCVSLFSQRTLIRTFAKKYPECTAIQKVIDIIKQKSFKKKNTRFVKFSIIHLNYVLRTRSFEATVNDYQYRAGLSKYNLSIEFFLIKQKF